jgi:hypothetical protein
MSNERVWKMDDTVEILKVISPFGINLIQELTNKDDLIFKCIVPKNSKVKRSNRYVKGDAAAKFAKTVIEQYRKNNNITGSYGVDFKELDITWNLENKDNIEELMKSIS